MHRGVPVLHAEPGGILKGATLASSASDLDTSKGSRWVRSSWLTFLTYVSKSAVGSNADGSPQQLFTNSGRNGRSLLNEQPSKSTDKSMPKMTRLCGVPGRCNVIFAGMLKGS